MAKTLIVGEIQKGALREATLELVTAARKLGGEIASLVIGSGVGAQAEDLAKKGGIPPLYLFLVSFIGGVYWLVCIYRIHVVLANAPNWKHPISPARAVGFHFIPFYQFYWIFKWPREIAKFVNSRLPQPIMKPVAIGVAVLAALSECIRRAFAAPPFQRDADPPVSS